MERGKGSSRLWASSIPSACGLGCTRELARGDWKEKGSGLGSGEESGVGETQDLAAAQGWEACVEKGRG